MNSKDFKEFNSLLQKHIKRMSKNQEYLFVVDLDKDIVWNTYLDSFPEGTNEMFRKRREYDCSCCRHFVRDLGRVVSLKNGKITTIWDFDTNSEVYQPVVDALSVLIKSKPILNVFVPTTKSIGVQKSVESFINHTWYHFYTVIPASLKKFNRDQIGLIQGKMVDTKNVFKRSLEEISQDSIDTVLELIAQKSLYKGEEWQSTLNDFRRLQVAYLKLKQDKAKEIFTWEKSVQVGVALAKIRNHSIGVLLNDISDEVELDEAVRKYEAIVAPSNYKRPKAIFTKKMVQQAQKTVEEMGLLDSLGRRFAKLEDITVPNTLFVNRNIVNKLSGGVFEELIEEVPDKPRNLSKIEEIGIDTFMKEVLPKASEISVLLENRHEANMVSLIAPKNKESKSLFKWNNSFSWAYSGNITDSMKDRVKSAGGKVDGVLRFSIQWNENNDTLDDLDAHCLEPRGNWIYFNNMKNRFTGGNLDVDVINPEGVAVENITWPTKSKMEKGKYLFQVHNYTSRGGKSGFSAEIEFDGKLYSFNYPKPLRHHEKVKVAEVSFDGDNFTIKELLKSRYASKEIWGLSSNKFHPVTIALHSPNYWDKQKGIGHKHYFFMLDRCKNPENPNGFFNEFLNEKLMTHKRVFEALGSKMRVEDSDRQLSGLGFSSTKRGTIICKVKGTFERMLKVKF